MKQIQFFTILLCILFVSKCNGKTVSYFPDEINDIQGPKPTDNKFSNVGNVRQSFVQSGNERQSLIQAVGALTNGVQNVLSSPTVQSILSNITVQNVLNDPLVQSVLSNANVQSVLSNPIIQGIITNPSFQGLSLQTILNSISPANLPIPIFPTTSRPVVTPTLAPTMAPIPSTTPVPPPPVPRPTSVFSQAQTPRPQQTRPQPPQRPGNNNALITTVLNGLDEIINMLETQIRRNNNRRRPQ